MTQDSNHKLDLDSVLRTMREDVPDATALQHAGDRVWQRMQAAPAMAHSVQQINGCEDVRTLLPRYHAKALAQSTALLVDAHLRDCVACRRWAHHEGAEDAVRWTAPLAPRRFNLRIPAFAMSAAAVAVLAVAAFVINNMYFAVPAGARATVQSLDGLAFRVGPSGEQPLALGDAIRDGEAVRTAAGAHAFVKLSDGSVVEMNERSELQATARGRNMTVALDQGAVIVQATKRKSGHLYVKTPDCRVAVTGTVFSVNAGLKGSRVSVIEGAVQVASLNGDSTLHPGDQAVTSDNMGVVPVREDISWSRDKESYFELMAQFAQLQKKLEQVQLPAARFTSNLAERMPADTLFYASIPNIGQALADANSIFQNQLAQSVVLRQWWTHGDQGEAEKLNATIEKLRQLGEYVGDEVVVAGFNGRNGADFAVIAEVRRSGLKEFLPTLFDDPKQNDGIMVVDDQGLAALPSSAQRRDIIALVRPDIVVFSPEPAAIQRVVAQWNTGASSFLQSDFGSRIAEAYNHGAGFLIAANLQQMIDKASHHAASQSIRRQQSLDRSGFGDLRYLIAEHREVNGTPDNRLVVDFSAQRHGMASWLAAPGPMGSLEFISRNAGVAFAFVAKEPQAIFDDMLAMATARHAQARNDVADTESKLRLRLREDLAAHFGGDAVIALDGPVLPTPAWKLVVEVHDATALQASLEKLIAAANDEAHQHGHRGLILQQEDVAGQRFYTVQNLDTPLASTHYTFSNGYMIVAQSRAFLMDSLRTHANGDSLARSAEFKKLLPNDGRSDYSAILYQNLNPIMQPLVSQLNAERASLVQQLVVDSKPSVICAWGDQSRIEATSNSRLFGFDWLALGSLLERGTGPGPRT